MTIKNFTFFSPNGTEFPVGSNNDGKLYMMLTGMDYKTIRRKDWSIPLNTALNVQYTNTSIIAGGRYFELLNETVALTANTVNYIHANIDLTKTTNPVNLSAETANNSNSVDLNNNSGVLKVLIDIRKTDGTGVISSEIPKQVSSLDELEANKVIANNFSLTSDVDWTNTTLPNTYWKKEGNTITIRWDLTKSGADGDISIGQIPSQYAPASSIMNVAAAFRGSDAWDCRFQINGSGANAGLVALLGAKSGQSYRGQFKYDI